ncbi:gfo/Idh/MocA family oxidoreductase [Candidatus Poribacteria bacterium]|nr:gfo/Idh/MocA family oxidoreductase [Candidatus Poribacteria bacterium]
MEKVKIGLVGTGGIGNHHASVYDKMDDVELVAVCDIFKDKAAQFAEKWNIPKKNVFKRYNKMLDSVDIDAVSVCTFNQAHRRPTVAALRAGKHVLCEKPMAARLADATAMVRAAKESGKILHIAIHSRYQPTVDMAQKIISAGILGDVYYSESTGCRRRGIPGHTFIYQKTAGFGAVVDIGVYNMHNTLFPLGYPKPVTVSAFTCDHIARQTPGLEDMDVEEFGAAWIRFEDGSIMVFKISWAVHANTLGPNYFLGKKAGLSLDRLEVYADSCPDGLEELVKAEGGKLNIQETNNMLNIKIEGLKPVDVWPTQIKAFADAVRNDGPSPIDPEGVLITNVIMDGIGRSVKKGKEVSVKFPEI